LWTYTCISFACNLTRVGARCRAATRGNRALPRVVARQGFNGNARQRAVCERGFTRVRRPRPRPPNTQSPKSQAKTRLVNGPENDCEPGPESVQPNSAEAKKLLRGHEAQNPQRPRPRPRPVYLLVYSEYSVQRQLTTTQAI